jgi:indole-3-glycerol phosphate synthase
MNILDEIIACKRKEIEKGKILRPIDSFENDSLFTAKTRSLVENLNKKDRSGIIAEFKRKSPSKGWFKKEWALEPVVKAYENFGAAGISVLTDENYFGGSLEDLVQTRKLVGLPVLRKDFIIDPWQLAQSKAYGADVILLIAACLTKSQIKNLTGYAKKIGLEVLLEIHNKKELDHICEEVDMVGVNNRDLDTFEVNLETSFKLIDKINNKPAIAESGINEVEMINKLRQAGFKGFLIGERFMKEKDPGLAFKEFVSGLKPTQEQIS